jgi:hypothetical protein
MPSVPMKGLESLLGADQSSSPAVAIGAGPEPASRVLGQLLLRLIEPCMVMPGPVRVVVYEAHRQVWDLDSALCPPFPFPGGLGSLCISHLSAVHVG